MIFYSPNNERQADNPSCGNPIQHCHFPMQDAKAPCGSRIRIAPSHPLCALMDRASFELSACLSQLEAKWRNCGKSIYAFLRFYFEFSGG
jgi:hypothetical protein